MPQGTSQHQDAHCRLHYAGH